MCVYPVQAGDRERVFEPKKLDAKRGGIHKMITSTIGDRIVIREKRNSTDDAWVWNTPAWIGNFNWATWSPVCFRTIVLGKISEDGLS